jgi:hypothetical protein
VREEPTKANQMKQTNQSAPEEEEMRRGEEG